MFEEFKQTPDFKNVCKKARLMGIDLEAVLDKAEGAVLPKLVDAIANKVLERIPAPVPAQPVNTDQVVKAVLAAMPLPENIDEEALIQKVALKLMDRVAALQKQLEEPMEQLQEAMLTLNQNLKTLQENQSALIQQQVDVVFKANSESLKQAINQQMEKIKEAFQGNKGTAGASMMNNVGSVAALAIENSDKVTALLSSVTEMIKVFKGGAPAASTEINSLVKGLTMGERIAKGQLSMIDLAKELIPGQPQA